MTTKKSSKGKVATRKNGPAARRKSVRAESESSPGSGRTLVFIHGIGNKPVAEVLKCQWDRALFGFELGERSRMAYWVDRDYHGAPESATCAGGDLITSGASPEAGPGGFGAAALADFELQIGLEREAAAYAMSPAARASLTRLAAEIEAGARSISEETVRTRSVGAKVLPLPAPLRRWLTRHLTKLLLHDVNDFFYLEARRRIMRDSLLERLRAGGGPFVVVAHSQGSMIAWDVLSRLDRAEIQVELFVTIGSPLGLTEVRDQLKRLAGTKTLRVPDCVDAWWNFADPLDPVCLDKRLVREFKANARGVVVEDELIWNQDSPRHPHSGTGYLSDPKVRRAVRGAVDTALFQQVASFTIARDLSQNLEGAPGQSRHEVLIELAAPGVGGKDLSAHRDAVTKALARIGGTEGLPPEMKVAELRHFVAAELTRFEVERLAAELGPASGARFSLRRVWRDAQKRALLETSRRTVHAAAAHIAYEALGEGIEWAVLDTGIRAAHPHFSKYSNVVNETNCTTDANGDDGAGHGTHVAGIIAGEYEDRAGRRIAGVAPKTKLHVYKVLDNDGSGRDSWIIRALDDIASRNEAAGGPVIQGVNLSLGGSFDVSTYACGHSPLCRELRRLARQGVLVVLAAGNEGFTTLESDSGPIEANMDLSIGDPANLEEGIAVGSVHKENPHTYGISYFSSRGPTADGRQKPDLVAPGEKILSARHRWKSKAESVDDLYVQMSGTSMAAPHVSGVLAAFLSVRREFIGQPEKVKTILLQSCIDLARDRPMQGAGLPNLVRMLVGT